MSGPSGTPVAPSRRSRAVPLVGAVLVGVLAAVQSRINGELSAQLGNGLVAAVWSFVTGLFLVGLLTLLRPAIRRGLRAIGAALRAGTLRRWHLFGGLFGGFFVGVQAAVVPILGVAVFTVATVAGQSVNSIVVDRVGLGPAGKQAVTGARVASAVIAVAAVAVAVANQFGAGSISAVPVVFAVLGGLGVAVQQAVNGRLAMAAGNAMSATLISFTCGATGLVLALAWRSVASGSGLPDFGGAPWWAYVGGFLGIFFVAISAWVVPIVGVLLFALLSIAGQLVGALLLDLIAPTTAGNVAWNLFVGVALAFVAVVVAARGRVRT